MNKLLKGRRISIGLAIGVVLLDQWSKYWVRRNLGAGREAVLFPGLIDLRLVWNNGAAFSLFPQGAAWLGLISFGVAIFLLLWLWRRGSQWRLLQLLAVGWLLGGTIGNGLDRWRFGAVVDFLDFVPISFPVFNLADVAINLAVLSLLINNLRRN